MCITRSDRRMCHQRGSRSLSATCCDSRVRPPVHLSLLVLLAWQRAASKLLLREGGQRNRRPTQFTRASSTSWTSRSTISLAIIERQAAISVPGLASRSSRLSRKCSRRSSIRTVRVSLLNLFPSSKSNLRSSRSMALALSVDHRRPCHEDVEVGEVEVAVMPEG